MHLNCYESLSPVRKRLVMKRETAFSDPNRKVIHPKRLKFLVTHLGSSPTLSLWTRGAEMAKGIAFSDQKRLILLENSLHFRQELSLTTMKKIKMVKETAGFDLKQLTPSMLNLDSSPQLSLGKKTSKEIPFVDPNQTTAQQNRSK